jgi:hypothetical protein
MTPPLRKLHNIPIPRHAAELPKILVVAWKAYHFQSRRQCDFLLLRPYTVPLWKVLDCGVLPQVPRRRLSPPRPVAAGAPAVVFSLGGGRRCISAVYA